MNHLTIIGIALALAMDAFAVSIACGTVVVRVNRRHLLFVAGMFGFFQGFMPFLGWISGMSMHRFVQMLDHWLAFFLLSIIGIKMIIEANKLKDGSINSGTNIDNPLVVFHLAFATSIDAFAAGLSFAFLRVSILEPVVIIGLVTWIVCMIGFFIGKQAGHIFERKVEIIGGCILILIGFKILFDHIL